MKTRTKLTFFYWVQIHRSFGFYFWNNRTDFFFQMILNNIMWNKKYLYFIKCTWWPNCEKFYCIGNKLKLEKRNDYFLNKLKTIQMHLSFSLISRFVYVLIHILFLAKSLAQAYSYTCIGGIIGTSATQVACESGQYYCQVMNNKFLKFFQLSSNWCKLKPT